MAVSYLLIAYCRLCIACEVTMTCYFRHLGDVFGRAGVEVTPQNKKQLDMIIHKIVNVDYKNCSATWREIKRRLAEDEEGFVRDLKEVLAKESL
jgi:hypothetical protein